MAADQPPTHATIVVKSPSNSHADSGDALRLEVPLSGTVRDIKEQLMRMHPDSPPCSTQRLIFAGRLLQDGTSTADAADTKSYAIRISILSLVRFQF